MLFDPTELIMREKIYKGLENHSDFELLEEYDTDLNSFKDYTNRLLILVFKLSGLKTQDFLKNHYNYRYLVNISSLLSPSVSTKFSVHYSLYATTLKALGTKKHELLL